VTCFFVNPGEAAREFGGKCCDQLEFYLFRNIYKFGEDILFIYALATSYNFLNGSFAKVWIFGGIPTRLMLGMQVNWDIQPRNRTFIQQESLRRVAWQIFNMDRLLAGGFDEYVACRAENMKIRLPCDEAAFRENRQVTSERLHDKPGKTHSEMGLAGYQLRVIDIRHRIQV
jgi:hypothetical protein